MSHFIKKCRHCGTTVSQCRCPSPYKQAHLVVCDECLRGPSDLDKEMLKLPEKERQRLLQGEWPNEGESA